MNKRIQFVIVFRSLFVLNDVPVEDAVGSIKIHDRTLIKGYAGDCRYT